MIPNIQTERLLLTMPGASAAQAYVRFNRENESHLAPWNPRMRPEHFDAGAMGEALERQIDQFREGTAYRFSVFERAYGTDGPLLGYLHFTEVVRGVFLACHMGYALAEAAQGKGYMTEACRAGIGYIFEHVRLHRIMASYMPHNHRSAAVLERLGFTIEGAAKEYLYIADRWQDHVLTSLTNANAVIPSF